MGTAVRRQQAVLFGVGGMAFVRRLVLVKGLAPHGFAEASLKLPKALVTLVLFL